MASVGKCLSLVAGGTFLLGAGATGLVQRSMRKKVVAQMQSVADENGNVPIGGRNANGDMWDGKVNVNDVKKDMKKKSLLSSLVTGLVAAIGTTAVAGLTLLLKAKVK